jgi:hypothetical protein
MVHRVVARLVISCLAVTLCAPMATIVTSFTGLGNLGNRAPGKLERLS